MTTDAQTMMISDLPAEIRESIYDHVFASDDTEVGGVLVGAVDDSGRAAVHGMIAALRADGTRASVTFTHDAWTEIIGIQERDFPDSPTIVGWYHSHPGFGIFLSEHDIFIQENFFREPFHVAYVIDPQDETEGMFAWNAGKLECVDDGRTPRRRGKRRTMVIDLDEAPTEASLPRPALQVASGISDARRIVSVDEEPVERRGRRRRWVVPAVLALTLLVAAIAAAALFGGNSRTNTTTQSSGPSAHAGGSADTAATNKAISKETARVAGFASHAKEKQHSYDKAVAAAAARNRSRGGGTQGSGGGTARGQGLKSAGGSGSTGNGGGSTGNDGGSTGNGGGSTGNGGGSTGNGGGSTGNGGGSTGNGGGSTGNGGPDAIG